ncbi:hypothetical protein ElyMa_003976600 [Elysia marginata]|uniref:Uncharacterized protein n=1 Tax=Elysia marginata TaxID=1093978 RepID=A0AAV4FZ92_9GAST|nr:hypothetical protein ElyMa_003976600 [Elysia marginata]
MRTLLVCLLVVALLGFVFAEPAVEKRQLADVLRKLADKVEQDTQKVIDLYNDSDLKKALGDAQDALKDAAGTVADKVSSIADKVKAGIVG